MRPWRTLLTVLSFLVVVAAPGCAKWESDRFADVVGHAPLVDASGKVVRHGPIITAALFPAEMVSNVNGPSLIAAPDWLPDRLGRYYDGLDFAVVSGRLGPSYSRVLQHDGWYYLFLGASGQRLARSTDGLSDLERGPMVLPRRRGAEPYSRHVALQRVGDVPRVYYTRKRDGPERILMGTIDLRKDWRSWKVVGETEILRPEMPYEGAQLPVRPSRYGPGRPEGENALRDPAIFEEDGRTWLLYAFAGERGTALAEVLF